MDGAQDGAAPGEVVARGLQCLASGAGLGEQLGEHGHDEVGHDRFGRDRALFQAVGVADGADALRTLGSELQRGARDVAEAVTARRGLEGLGQVGRACPGHGREQAGDQGGEAGGEVGSIREPVGR